MSLVDCDKEQLAAMYVAAVVRAAMEDFHVQHLSDEQMAELNPIIRNAIHTALYAKERYATSEAAQEFMRTTILSIPAYWEPPELLVKSLDEDV